jgi:ribosomal-protein-alanine N-acetyltransferase
METLERTFPGDCSVETGAGMGFHVAPVSHFWLGRLVDIDSNWNPKSWSVQLFEKELSSRSSSVRGLFVANELVGYLIAHVVCDEAHIVSLGLAPEFRGKGGGRFLLADFLRGCGGEGVHVVTLDVRVSNIPARKLYEQGGFSVVGLRRNYYSDNGEDALTMRRESRPIRAAVG